jgi:hypothetical protein
MKIDDLLQQVAEGYQALIEVAELAGIHIRSISNNPAGPHVHFVTEEGIRFTIDMRPIIESPRPIEDALEIMRSAHDAARQPQDMN